MQSPGGRRFGAGLGDRGDAGNGSWRVRASELRCGGDAGDAVDRGDAGDAGDRGDRGDNGDRMNPERAGRN